MTKEAAINMSYLYAAELLKEAAEEQGVDLDAQAQEMTDEEMADLLDSTVMDLANAGELEPIFEDVEADEEDVGVEVDEGLEQEAGFFFAKTAALLEKAAEEEKEAFNWGAGAEEAAADAEERASSAKHTGERMSAAHAEHSTPAEARKAVMEAPRKGQVPKHNPNRPAYQVKPKGSAETTLGARIKGYASKIGEKLSKHKKGILIGGGVVAAGTAGLIAARHLGKSKSKSNHARA